MPRRSTPAATATADTPVPQARSALLDAAEVCLREQGFSGFSTRKVADMARMPLSQIHYHFGSKEALVLAVLEQQNHRLLHRQEVMFATDTPLWQRWDRACDFLDEDIQSGYVRILQEMISVGWSRPEIAAAVRTALQGWYTLLADIAREASARIGGLGPLQPDDVAALVGNAFLGSEAMLLLGFEEQGMPIRRALRRIGPMIRELEERAAPAQKSTRKR
jgi:AcrR family transcriptional regulator